jgi:hypothetical protein
MVVVGGGGGSFCHQHLTELFGAEGASSFVLFSVQLCVWTRSWCEFHGVIFESLIFEMTV